MSIWNRKGLFYYAYLAWKAGSRTGVVEKKLDFVSYHLIRLIHGEERLEQMARSMK